MEYMFMFPDEQKRAMENNLPLLIPVGNIEYHGAHSVCGTDIIITQGVAYLLEKQIKLVLAPALVYAPSSHAASGPELGTLNVDMDLFEQYIKGILRGFIEGGWKNIYILIHHQYDTEILFPMTLACLKAGKQIFFESMEERRGRGWFARAEDLSSVLSGLNTVKVLPVLSREVQTERGYDHAGKVECSLLKALKPEMQLVKPENIRNDEWFAQTAAHYSEEYGQLILQRCLKDLKNKIT